jgi:hypothetical protein
LRKARQQPFGGPSPAAPDFSRKIKERLLAIYPEKYDFIGDAAIDGTIRRALEEARRHGVTSDAGAALFIGLMFTVGHGMARDPHLPWIGHTLGNTAIADPNKRAERLYSKAMTYLDAILSSLP